IRDKLVTGVQTCALPILGRDVTATLVNVYAMRMAAVFTLTTVTIARRTQIVSRWLTVAGIAAALVLLVGVGISAWAELLFPAWKIGRASCREGVQARGVA